MDLMNHGTCITETFDEVPAGQNFVISGERRRCLEKGIGSAKLAVFDSCRLANGTDIQIGESINRLKSGELIPFNKDNNMHIYTCTMVCDPFSNTNNCIPINECHRICLDRQEGPFCDCRGPPICNDTTTCTVKPKDKEGTTKLPKTTTTSIPTTAPPEWCTEKDIKTSLPSSTTTEKYSITKITIPEETTTSVQSTSTKEQHATTSVINLSTTKERDTIQTETSTTPKISTSTEQYSTSTEQYSTSTEQYSTSTEEYSTSTEQYSTSTEQYSTSTEQYSTSTEYTVTRDGNWTTSSQDSTTPELNTTPKEITTTTVTYINSTSDSTTSPTTISHVTNSTSEVKTSTEPSSPLHCSNPCSEGHEAFTTLVEYLCPETCLVTTTQAKVLAENWDMLSSVLLETQACYMKNP
uniref:MANSC domain-containing protein n=1 Tax=Heterorhabditis bacteriophora TaxID=37862 RepID=A0A1I7XVJ6_HETBA